MSLQHHEADDQFRSNVGAMRFVSSKMFSNIFTEGMQLVEETASYLDGEGREAARTLDRTEALSYAGMSMRLTTRLMQIASWLLVMRAVREGDMSYGEAAQDKYRLGSPEPEKKSKRADAPADTANLPPHLLDLREETARLYKRIVRIDTELFEQPVEAVVQNDAAARIATLKRAFAVTGTRSGE